MNITNIQNDAHFKLNMHRLQHKIIQVLISESQCLWSRQKDIIYQTDVRKKKLSKVYGFV